MIALRYFGFDRVLRMFHLVCLFGRFCSAVHFQVSCGAEDCHLKSVSSLTIQIHLLDQQGYTSLDHLQSDVDEPRLPWQWKHPKL